MQRLVLKMERFSFQLSFIYLVIILLFLDLVNVFIVLLKLDEVQGISALALSNKFSSKHLKYYLLYYLILD